GASAAEELNAQSATLKRIVNELEVLVGGGNAETSGPRLAPFRREPSTGSIKAGVSPSLQALRKAVVHKPQTEAPAQHVVAGNAAEKDSFPLDADFKEF